MTFSIVARCCETGMLGVAVASSSPAVAARCAHARAGTGAVASQNVTDPSLGTRALDLLALGAEAGQTVDVIRASARHLDYRQILIVDSNGHSAVHSGPRALGIWAEAKAENVACGGNLLADPAIPQIMVSAFLESEGRPLGDRLIHAMYAGLEAGGEAGPIHSAGMKLVRDVAWPVADLRIDWTEQCPIRELDRLWELYKPQLEAYIVRALHPEEAPSYGVPGDL